MTCRWTFQAEGPLLDKQEVCRVVGKIKQKVAKTGLPIFHACALQLGRATLTGIPVIRCCMTPASKHSGLHTNPFIRSCVFVGQEFGPGSVA